MVAIFISSVRSISVSASTSFLFWASQPETNPTTELHLLSFSSQNCVLVTIPDCVITCCLTESDTNFTQIASTHLMNCFHVYKSGSLSSHFTQLFFWGINLESPHIVFPASRGIFNNLVFKGIPAFLFNTWWVDMHPILQMVAGCKGR